ncbi:MAG: glycosyl transferase [Thioalkalivibrionaceae bacterium]
MNEIICIKWGTMYGPEYVNQLYAGLARHCVQPFRLTCFTDDPTGIRAEVRCEPLPNLGCPVPSSGPGKWSKLRLWNAELADLAGRPALFLDLDVVITGPIEPFFDYGDPDDVILMRNWVRPLERLGQTSVFRFPVGRHSALLDRFRLDPEGIAERYQFEQRFVTRNVPGGVKFFPRQWLAHFRIDCLPVWPLRIFQTPRRPRKAAIVIFPGDPKPSDAILGQWNEDLPHLPYPAHLRRAWRFARDHKRPFFRLIRRHFKPAAWIAEEQQRAHCNAAPRSQPWARPPHE